MRAEKRWGKVEEKSKIARHRVTVLPGRPRKVGEKSNLVRHCVMRLPLRTCGRGKVGEKSNLVRHCVTGA